MVITRLNKWFGIELYCVSTDRVSDLAAIEWFRSQRLTTGYLEVDMKPDRICEDVPLFPETVDPDAVDPNPGTQHGFGPPNGAKPQFTYFHVWSTYEFDQIITRYDFLDTRLIMLGNVWFDFKLT